MENTTVLRSKLPCVSSSSGSCKPFRLGTACRNPGTSTVGAGGTQNRCRYQPTAQTTLGNKQLRNDNEVIKAKTCSPFQPPAPMSSSKPGAETMFSDEQTGHQRATRDPQHRWELTRSPLAIMFG